MAGALALEAVGLAGRSRSAADRPTARFVTRLRSMVQGVAWVGPEAGIFSGVGVDVRFPKLETAGPEAEAGLIRGEWALPEVGISPVVQGALDGQDTVILAQALPTTRGTSLIVRNGITEWS
jgi:hypothetical protein